MKLAPSAVHYLAWALGLLAALSPKLSLAFPQLAGVFDQLTTVAPLMGVWLGTSAASSFQSGQSAAATPTAVTVEQALATLAQAAAHKPAPAAPPTPPAAT